MSRYKITLFLIFKVLISITNQTKDKTEADAKCTLLKNITIFKGSDCFTGSYSYYYNYFDSNSLSNYNETYISEANDDLKNIEECCFFKSNNTQIGSYCDTGYLVENNTQIIKNDNSYTKICVPFNTSAHEANNLMNYNSPLIPCASDIHILSSDDCFNEGNLENYCCHMYGYISGININQCYYFKRGLGRPGIFNSNGISIYCLTKIIDISSLLLILISLLVLYT